MLITALLVSHPTGHERTHNTDSGLLFIYTRDVALIQATTSKNTKKCDEGEKPGTKSIYRIVSITVNYRMSGVGGSEPVGGDIGKGTEDPLGVTGEFSVLTVVTAT